jgi:hypothetical protein
MSQEEQQDPTIDDVWVNRLAMKLGILTAQNERLMIENEALMQQLKQMQEVQESVNLPSMNGELVQ